MKTVFFGTPRFSVPALERFASMTDLQCVITGPDVRKGRGKKLQPPPVKQAALAMGLRVLQPRSIRDLDFLDYMKSLELDLGVVVAFGRILGRRLLRTPRFRFVNVHASLLPLLRGAAPIERAIMEGHGESGISIMRMAVGLDTGPVYLTRHTSIAPRETAGSLHDKLMLLGADALEEYLRLLIDSDVPEPKPQNSELATYAAKITGDDERIDWSREALVLDRQIRGLYPRPGASTYFRGKRVRVLEAEPVCENGEPGLLRPGKTPLVFCGKGALVLRTLQMAGKRALSAYDFFNGYRVVTGECFTDDTTSE